MGFLDTCLLIKLLYVVWTCVQLDTSLLDQHPRVFILLVSKQNHGPNDTVDPAKDCFTRQVNRSLCLNQSKDPYEPLTTPRRKQLSDGLRFIFVESTMTIRTYVNKLPRASKS